MKTDTQHLDYLISQYVDGCLEGAQKKSLEQRLLNDPDARTLYKEQHDVQEVLDDWGNRIPLINWDDFDQKLAKRLENETVGGQGPSTFRLWTRRLSIAASIAIAASVGYGWHAWSMSNKAINNLTAGTKTVETPSRGLVIEPEVTAPGGSSRKFFVDEGPVRRSSAVASNGGVEITAPGNIEASESLKEGVAYGLSGLSDTARISMSAPNASTVHVAQASTPVIQKEITDTAPPAP